MRLISFFASGLIFCTPALYGAEFDPSRDAVWIELWGTDLGSYSTHLEIDLDRTGRIQVIKGLYSLPAEKAGVGQLGTELTQRAFQVLDLPRIWPADRDYGDHFFQGTWLWATAQREGRLQTISKSAPLSSFSPEAQALIDELHAAAERVLVDTSLGAGIVAVMQVEPVDVERAKGLTGDSRHTIVSLHETELVALPTLQRCLGLPRRQVPVADPEAELPLLDELRQRAGNKAKPYGGGHLFLRVVETSVMYEVDFERLDHLSRSAEAPATSAVSP